MFSQRDGADDIGPAHDTDDFVALHDRQPFDFVYGHELGDLFHGRLFVDAHDLGAHDAFHLPRFFGEDIGFGDDTDDLTVLGGHRARR